jgi:transcriptional regulator with XRE-family HTH domain
MDVFTADPKKVGRNIGRIRRARGAKQVDVARVLGVSQEHMSNIETGRRLPSLRLLIGLCKALSSKPEEIIAEEEDDEDEVV